ncbi:MAG: metallophosphoesterase [Verrucomicrobia bacterium]|nr:metallophosphoesterase [Verrucomicrobiota bacterium]
MKNLCVRTCGLGVFLWIILAANGWGASVEPDTGYGSGFDTQPVAADWTTTSVDGSASDSYDMDQDVNATVVATAVTAAPMSVSASPPEADAMATWSSTGFYVQTRPTGVRYTVLMGTFLNNTGTNATQIRIAYDLVIASGGISEDVGTRAYYSVSGLAGSWVSIPALNSTASSDGTTPMSATVSLEWTNTATLYVAWLDDNASGMGTDSANQIDNFSLQVTAGLPVSTALLCTVTAPAPDAILVSTDTVTLRAGVIRGSPPYAVQFFTNSGAGSLAFELAGSSATEPFEVSLGSLAAGTYNVYAVATDSAAEAETSVSPTNTFQVLDPITLTLVAPAQDAMFDHLTRVAGTVTVTGGTPPYAVQFFLDDTPSGDPLTAEPYAHDFGLLFVGDHTVSARVTDARDWVSNSPVHTIHISGPVAAILSPADGTTYNYGQEVILSAILGGGTPPYTAQFYANDTLVGTVDAAPYATNLGILAEGSYLCYLRAIDSTVPAPGEFFSSTNVVTIAPNPLAATLTSPVNNQNVPTNVGIAMSVTATVATPLSVAGVEFFVDDLSLGVDSEAPFAFRTTSVSMGSHTVYAVATDTLGRQVATVTNTVNGVYDPLANDMFANRIVLAGPVADTTASNVGATTEGGEPTSSGWFTAWGATLWWTWTAPASGTVRIDTVGSSFNTSLGVYRGTSVNALTQVAFNDNAPGMSDVSLVTFTATEGTDYQIQVGGMRRYGPGGGTMASGSIQLNLIMPPTVAITEPAGGAVYTAGSNFVISATASSPHGPIAQVDFYAGSEFLGTATAEPYSVAAVGVLPGTNRLTAVATDAIGLVGTSAVVTVTVLNAGLTVVSPADGATYTSSNPITIRAVAWQTAGTVTNVEFLVDGEAVGQDTNAPFSTVWASPTPGLHRLTASGTDDAGNGYLSTICWIAVAEPVVASGSVWNYLDDGSDQGTAWQAPDFDDSAWKSGPAELGYGDGDEATVVGYGPDENNKYPTTYFRHAFVVPNPATLNTITLAVERDDGAVVYLNGREVLRSTTLPAAPAVITYTNFATGGGFGSEDTTDTVTLSATNLVEGVNVLAVEIHQESGSSSDISFNLSLSSMPEIIRNQLPVPTFLHVANNDFFFAPARIVLDAEAFDPDGYVTNLAIYAGTNKVAETTGDPCAYEVNDVAPGIYSFTAVALDNGGVRGSKTVLLTVYERLHKWVAYNDHYAGANTHPNASAWNAFGTTDGAPGDEGPLRSIATGAPLPVFLNVFALGALGDSASGAPPAGTPAYDTFNGYVDFGAGDANHAIVLSRDSLVFHFFTGLDPTRRYSLRATAVGGVPEFRNRWTQFALVSAGEATAAHTAGVLTCVEAPEALGPDEAAMNTGDNLSGDMVGWDDIAPGADGSFTLVSTLYLGPAPGNIPAGPYAYAPVAVRLEETGTRPYVVLTQPTMVDYYGWTDLPIAATASAVEGVTNVWFLANGKPIGADATRPYSMVWSNADFGYTDIAAVAVDSVGARATSAVVNVFIVPPPDNTEAPVIALVSPPDGALLDTLTEVAVTFSEDVYGVDPGDLLLNGTPATAVSGTGSNYVFAVAQPPVGNVRISWAPSHGITDRGYPASLLFDASGPGARWYYTMADRIAPVVIALDPPVAAGVTNLNQITVTFSEPVDGVNASDLIVRGAAATGLSGSGAIYTFTFPSAPYGPVVVRWATAPGITDRATVPNAFVPSGGWNYVVNAGVVLVPTNAAWRAFKGTEEASAPLNAWRETEYDDAHWATVSTPVFYGDPYDYLENPGTLLPDMEGGYACVFLRKSFTLDRAAYVTNMTLRAQSDDGFIAWINGVEVCRVNVPLGEPSCEFAALVEYSETASGVAAVNYALPDPYGYVREGLNVLAVQAFNVAATNDDFVFETQLTTYRYNPAMVGPGIIRVAPPAGSIFELTNITVLFNEPVSGVDPEDLLVNGVPAVAVSGGTSNDLYTFTVAQPAYGAVAITWAATHGIADFDATPRAFNVGAANSKWQYVLLNPRAPVIVSQDPVAGAMVNQLDRIGVVFSEPVVGLTPDDLLVNGVAATGLSLEGTTYTFSFPQPPYGNIAITWSPTHNITDTENPPVAFNLAAPGSTWSYTLIDRTPPALAEVVPDAALTATNLTMITITFTEAVVGVDETDLLVNGVPAAAVSGSGTTYTFTFPQPNASAAAITWTAGHGIADTAFPANAFDAAAPEASWTYATLDNVPPSLAAVSPPAGTTVRSLTRVNLTFDEPVAGLEAGDLLLNGVPASGVSGADAGPYAFLVEQPGTGEVQVALSGEFTDVCSPPNVFPGATWTYLLDTNLPPPTLVRPPYLQVGTPTSMIVRWRTETACDSQVRYGLAPDDLSLTAEDVALTTEHEVALTNLTPYTRYYYSVGTIGVTIVGGADYHFRTHPTNAVPTRLFFVSDFGFANTTEASVRDAYLAYAAATKPADVFLTGGDNDQVAGQDDSYTATVFGSTYGYAAMFRNLPVFPTIGNHDYMNARGAAYYASFTLPMRGEAGGLPSGTEQYYSFNYGDIHFICLDSIDGSCSSSSETPMIEWLRQDLALASQMWTIAYWHGPPYSKGSHDSDSTTDTLAWMVQMREHVLPVLEANGVDLVLTGHSHVYERTWLLYGHYGFSSTFNATNKIDAGDGKLDGNGAYRQAPGRIGTVYVTAGVGGQPRNSFNIQHPAHLLKKTGIPGSLIIDINGGQLDFKYLNNNGVTEDYFTLLKSSPSSGPMLFITQHNENCIVSWSATTDEYDLKHTGSLSPAASWQSITNVVSFGGTNQMFQFVPSASSPAGFFRLEKR